MPLKNSSMTPDELKTIVTAIYGERAQVKLAQDIARGEVTVSRWLHATVPVGAFEARMLRLLYVLWLRSIPWQAWVEEYMGEKPAESIEEFLS